MRKGKAMKNLGNKLNKQNGFTLIEMLVVVAIIAVLVAVSIPVVNNALEKTRVATDAANERAAKAAATICYLNGEARWQTSNDYGDNLAFYYYDGINGKLISMYEIDDGGNINMTVIPKGYGKCKDHKNGVIFVTISEADGVLDIAWMAGDGDGIGDYTPHNGIVE